MRHNERSHQNPYIRNVKEDEQFKGRNLSKWQGDVPASLHSETVGEKGPVLEQDNILLETLETQRNECMKLILSKILESSSKKKTDIKSPFYFSGYFLVKESVNLKPASY